MAFEQQGPGLNINSCAFLRNDLIHIVPLWFAYFYFLLFYHQEEQTGAIVDPSSSNPYHMSIEEYFNPSTEQNTRGMCAYSVGGISQCTAVIGTNGIKIYKSSKMHGSKLRLIWLPVQLTFSPW